MAGGIDSRLGAPLSAESAACRAFDDDGEDARAARPALLASAIAPDDLRTIPGIERLIAGTMAEGGDQAAAG